jgi:hypothetical protein
MSPLRSLVGALSITAAAALCEACGGSQPPIGALESLWPSKFE